MPRRLTPACVFLLALLAAGMLSRSQAEPAKNATQPSLNDMSMEVGALQMLHQFQFTPQQMEALRKIAKETGQEPTARQRAKVSDEFRQTLVDLRSALIDDDDERIEELQEKLEDLREADTPQLDDGVEVTETAKELVPDVLRLLSPRQVAAHLANYGDELPDPLDRFLRALDRVRGLDAAEWKKQRDEISEEVGRLAAGLDADKAGDIANKVVQLLIQVRALKEDEFKKQRPEFEKTARKIVGDLGPFDVLHHLVEQSLAELLSNPRLISALDVRLAR